MALKNISPKIKRFFAAHWRLISIVAASLLLLLVFVCNIIVSAYSAGFVFDDISRVPENEFALVLGCAPRTRDGVFSETFKNRIEAAAQLYKQHKVEYIVVSGARRNTERYNYDEPYEMKDALIVRGVPDDRIIMDPSGFRTLDSMIRADKIMGLKKFTVVSQHYHNTRAIFIGRHHGLDVIAYDAANAPGLYQIAQQIRETMAKVLVIFDLYVFDTEPAVLNDEINMPKRDS